MTKYEIPVESLASIDLRQLLPEMTFNHYVTEEHIHKIINIWCCGGELGDFDNFKQLGVRLSMLCCVYPEVEADTLEEAKEKAIQEAKKIHELWNETEIKAFFSGYIIHDEYIYERGR
jgi:hypothetical protein